MESLLVDLAKNGVEDEAGDGAGWVLNLLTGGSASDGKTQQQILNEVTAINGRLDALSVQVDALQKQVNQALVIVCEKVNQTQLTAVLSAQQTAIADIQAWTFQLNLAATSGTHKLPSDLINEIQNKTLTYIELINNTLTGATPGLKAALGLYDNGYREAEDGWSTGTDPGILTARYVHGAYTQTDYYYALLTQALVAYAEAIHSSPADNPNNHDPVTIGKFSDLIRQDNWNWTGSSTSHVPVIPDDTAVDARTPGAFTMWTSKPVTLAGTLSNYYCSKPVPSCYYSLRDQGNTVIGASARLVPPPVAPLGQYLVSNPLGFTDWRIPTVKDFSTLVRFSYAGQPQPNGVGQFGTWQNLPILTPVTINRFGSVTQDQVIKPLVVDDNTGQVMTANPSSATLTPESGVSLNGDAGVLALVRAQSVVPKPTPSAPAAKAVPKRSAPATAAASGLGSAKSSSRAQVRTGSRATGVSIQPPVFTTTTFSTPTVACSNNVFTVPADANAVRVTVTGAAGTTVHDFDRSTIAGGHGGSVSAVIPVSAGTKLYAQVGGTSGGTGGGVNGGAGGGSSYPTNTGHDYASGGGGGASSLSLDSGCNRQLAIAGGGGGAGGNNGQAGSNGYAGGDACPINNTGACKGHDGIGKGIGVGNGGTVVGGGLGGTEYGNRAGNGGDGAPLTGGSGGSGGDSGKNIVYYHNGGGGGGGGGGYGGGGGGGGSTAGTGGAGGAGGASWITPGVAGATFAVAGSLTGGSVSITPTQAPEYRIGHADANNTGVLDNSGGSSILGNPLLRYPSGGGANQQWGLLFRDAPGNPFHIVNPDTAGCANAAAFPPVTGTAVQLAPCTELNSDQGWIFQPQPDGSFQIHTGVPGTNPLVMTANVPGGADSTVQLQPAQPGLATQSWALLASPQSVWSFTADTDGLRTLTTAKPRPVSTRPVSTRPGHTIQLAATGPAPAGQQTLLGLVLLILGAALTTLARPRRRRSSHD